MATLVVAHPGCYDDEALQQDTPLVFCPVEDEGVCCTLEEEQDAILLYSTYAQVIQDAAENNADAEACGEAWKEVRVCARVRPLFVSSANFFTWQVKKVTDDEFYLPFSRAKGPADSDHDG